ncbi:IQ domain-containing protein IQM1-like [Actinidia eriantha]|uniref:IQ domain-containing protein IQM1-like n=1 Tax=Actinidia eriantha TaxID=165200 RepID=UPI00258B2F9D|nr:IQ domain-containing protein IQM1-like [Actinidia eriantha]
MEALWKLETSITYMNLVSGRENGDSMTKDRDEMVQDQSNPSRSLGEVAVWVSPRPVKLNEDLADCAVVGKELWWKALEYAVLTRSSVSFFSMEKPETTVSRWARAGTRAAKVGKGLSKDEKAQKLALKHWLEAIDPRHRYGHNLHFYYQVWFKSQSSQPFFYWLDVGDGKEVNLEKCERTVLQHQCIKYLGPKERAGYEVIIDSGKLVYRQSGVLVDTIEGSKWIFVLSTSRKLYVGEKKQGFFQHSSFLAGGATTSSGRLVARNGLLEAIWPYSGHYCPAEENFMEFISFLEKHNVDLSNVKMCAIDDDVPPQKGTTNEKARSRSTKISHTETLPSTGIESADATSFLHHQHSVQTSRDNGEAPPTLKLDKRISSKRKTGAGHHISCVKECLPEMQFPALEQVNLSPRIKQGPFLSTPCPIHTPRPSPKIHLALRLVNIGLPSPRVLKKISCAPGALP